MYASLCLSLLSVAWLWQTCRELHKLDSITRTPLLSHCVETVAGLRTIRAFRSVGILSLATSLIDRFSTHSLFSNWQRMFDDGRLGNKWHDQFFGFVMKWKWKCIDFKWVQKPAKRPFSLIRHACILYWTTFFLSGQVRLKLVLNWKFYTVL